MIPDEALLPPVSANQVRHAALDKPVALTVEADSRYPACGPESLTDGLMGKAACGSPEWLGFEGKNLEAVIDLGAATPIRRVGANFLQVVPMGVFLPTEVEFSVSNDGKTFRALGALCNDVPADRKDDLTKTFTVERTDVTARYVRVRAANLGTLPAWHAARGRKAWLFVDEVLVNW
jgi:hexosaminidase